MKAANVDRKQFTFYKSFLNSVQELPKSRQQETVMAILEYGLMGTEPSLNGASLSVFEAIRPILDASRSKAAARLKRIDRQEEGSGGALEWEDDGLV